MDFLSIFDLLILPAIGLVAGKFLKTQPWYDNKFIPIGNLVVIVFTKIVVALGLGVSDAHAAPAVVGILGIFGWKAFLWEAAKAVLATLLATGTHSAGKNLKQGLEG